MSHRAQTALAWAIALVTVGALALALILYLQGNALSASDASHATLTLMEQMRAIYAATLTAIQP